MNITQQVFNLLYIHMFGSNKEKTSGNSRPLISGTTAINLAFAAFLMYNMKTCDMLSGCQSSTPTIEETDPEATQADYQRMCEELLNSDAYIDLGTFDSLGHTMAVNITDQSSPSMEFAGIEFNFSRNEGYKNIGYISSNYGFKLKKLLYDITTNDSSVYIKVKPYDVEFYDTQLMKGSKEERTDVFDAIDTPKERIDIEAKIDGKMKEFIINNMDNRFAQNAEKHGTTLVEKLLPIFSPLVVMANNNKKSCIIETVIEFDTHEITEEISFQHGKYTVNLNTNVNNKERPYTANGKTTIKVISHFDKTGTLTNTEIISDGILD